MAFSTVFTAKRSDIASLTSTAQSRGLVINGKQVETQVVSKLTGDTTGNVTLTTMNRPDAVYAIILKDNLGADQATLSTASLAFTQTNNTTIALSGLGNWTRAMIFITGRAYA